MESPATPTQEANMVDIATGTEVLITVPHTWPPDEYTATVMCVDFMGTITFKRHEDDYIGIAGSGTYKAA